MQNATLLPPIGPLETTRFHAVANAKASEPQFRVKPPMKLERPTKLGHVELRAIMERRPFSILSWSSGLLALTFILYYGLQATSNPQLGGQFVQSEWPPPGISPYFFAKPITWFAYFSFLYWTFGLEAKKARFLTISPELRRFLFIGTAVVAFGAFYEIFFNFAIWSALIAVTSANCAPYPCTPDNLANPFPNVKTTLNLVFATKVVTTVFALSIYSLWFLNRVEKELDRKENASAMK